MAETRKITYSMVHSLLPSYIFSKDRKLFGTFVRILFLRMVFKDIFVKFVSCFD